MTTMTGRFLDLEIRRGAPETLRNVVRHGDEAQFQQAMTRQHRTVHKRLAKSAASGASSILWSEDQLRMTPADQELTSLLAGNKRCRRAARNVAVESLLDGDCRPLIVLTCVDTLVRHGREMNHSKYVALYTALSRIDRIRANPDTTDEAEQFVQRLICEGELPLLLSLALGDLKGRSSRFKTAARVLKLGLEAGTDTDGMLHATLSSRADTWLVPFVRSALWGAAFGKTWLTSGQMLRLADTVRICATLLVRTGLVSDPPADVRDSDSRAAEVIEHGIQAVGICHTSPLAALVRSHVRRRPAVREKKQSRRRPASNQSDWAESAILRSGLRTDSDVCIVNWDQPESSIWLAVLGIPLIAGGWSTELMINGKSRGRIEGWTCSCWFCDEEAAFVEIEAHPVESVRAVRHVILSLEDHTCIVCESVTIEDDPAAEVRLKSGLSLAANPLAVTNSVTREIVLHADGVAARVVPAWLEDDKVQHAVGECAKVDDRLVSEAVGHGGALLPLVVDWHPDRQGLDADWNRLTVTEARTVLTTHHAAGYRVRIGGHQLLIYRALRPGQFARAVLGLHTMNESVYGRVKKSGDIAPLVLVDGNPD